MLFRKKLTQAAEVVMEPAKKAVQDHIEAAKKSVGDNSDWGAKLFKFILGGLFVIFTFREEREQQNRHPRLPSQSMPNIVINNYIKEDPHDHKYQRDPANRQAKYRGNGQNGGRIYPGSRG